MKPEECKSQIGRVVPVIDRNRCEAKAACVEVCPYHVFEIQKISEAQKSSLSWRGKIKSFFHGGKQAIAARADLCHACGECVKACPENAITLVKADSATC